MKDLLLNLFQSVKLAATLVMTNISLFILSITEYVNMNSLMTLTAILSAILTFTMICVTYGNYQINKQHKLLEMEILRRKLAEKNEAN